MELFIAFPPEATRYTHDRDQKSIDTDAHAVLTSA